MTKHSSTPHHSLTKKRILPYIRHHKLLIVFVIIGLALVAVIAGIRYDSYLAKFSAKDYAQLEEEANNVMAKAGANEIYNNKTCRYRAPAEFSSNRLYCGIELAAYIPYQNDAHAIAVAKSLAEAIRQNIDHGFIGFQGFYDKPYNNFDSRAVDLPANLHREQCLVYVESNQSAKDAIGFLPKQTSDNLIAISFSCSGEARKAYFPVTYRQGQ